MLMPGHRWLRIFFVVLLGAGCPSQRGTPTPVLLDAAVPEDAGVSLEFEAVLTDGGVVVLNPEAGSFAVTEPASELRMTAHPQLTDFRVRVFDETEKALVSDDEASVADSGTYYRVQLAQPLKSGFKYTVVVDGQTSPERVDISGRRYPELRLPIQISGEKEKPPPPPARKKRRR